MKRNEHILYVSELFVKKYAVIFTCFFFALIALIQYVRIILRAAHTEITFDDAYMFLRYAHNFWAGHGIAWNSDGIQTYGTTSLLYLFLMIVLRGIWSSSHDSTLLLIGSVVPGCLAIIVLIFSAYFARSHDLQKKGRGYIYLLGTVLPIAVWFTPFPFHSVNGMDTNLSFLCNAVLIGSTLLWLYQRVRYAVFFTIGAAYLTYLARPDNLIYAGLFPILCILSLSPQRKADLQYFIAGLSLLLLLDSGLKLLIFGNPLPLSFYAKSNGYYDGYLGAAKWNPLTSLFDFLSSVLPFMIVTLIFISRNSLKLCVAFMLPVIITFFYYFSVVQIMGTGARFYFPAFPFLVVNSFLVADQYWQEHGVARNHWNRKPGLLRLISIMGVCCVSSSGIFQYTLAQSYSELFLSSQYRYTSSIKYETVTQKPALPSLGWWKTITEVADIAVQFPTGTNVALSEYGLIGARASQIQIIDPLGLHDPVFALYGFSADEFLKRTPDFIWFPHPDYTKITASILNSKKFWATYNFYPTVFDYGIAIKKDSWNTNRIYQILNSSFRKNYGGRDLSEYLAKPIPG